MPGSPALCFSNDGLKKSDLARVGNDSKVSDVQGHFRLLESAHYSTNPIRLCEREMPLSRWLGTTSLPLVGRCPNSNFKI